MNLDKIISLALEEDSALNDITSKNIISKDTVASAVLMAKHSGIICGLDVFKQVFLSYRFLKLISKQFLFPKHFA